MPFCKHKSFISAYFTFPSHALLSFPFSFFLYSIAFQFTFTPCCPLFLLLPPSFFLFPLVLHHLLSRSLIFLLFTPFPSATCLYAPSIMLPQFSYHFFIYFFFWSDFPLTSVCTHPPSFHPRSPSYCSL